MTAALVVACFGFFLGVVRLTFPEGMSLRGFIQPAEGLRGAVASAGRSIDLSGGAGREEQVARLVRVVRKVKNKPPEAIAWLDAREGLALGEMHSIQTLAGSEATIAFGSGGSLVLGENSLIVLKSFDGESDGTVRRVTIAMFGGELHGSLGSGPDDVLRMVVETPSGETTLEAESRGALPAPKFRVEVREDRGSTFTVFEGTARITVGGKSVDVGAREGLSVGPDGAVEKPRPLLAAPELHEPTADSRITRDSRPAWMLFRWGRMQGATSYRLVLEPDAGSTGSRQERTLADTTITLGVLEPGSWTWTVSSRSKAVEGEPSEAHRFQLVFDGDGPSLEVAWPGFVVREKTLRLTGSTEPGARVFVSTQAAETDSAGNFEVRLQLSRGGNSVVVEAVDGAGNRTYRSRTIKALF